MKLPFDPGIAAGYKSTPQKIRVLTEHWFATQAYCPSCGRGGISQYSNNRPVADFFCSSCKEEFELKGHGQRLGAKIVDGAYRTMMERLQSSTNPNLFLLGYDMDRLAVRSLMVIPKHFFTVDVIEARKPLGPDARRAGWIGCNIRLDGIPAAGRIVLIRDGHIQPASTVTAQWRKSLFLREQPDLSSRKWLLSIMKCIDRVQRAIFTLAEIYRFEEELAKEYPGNRHIRPKIRQQLQVLRDRGYLRFRGGGTYELTDNSHHLDGAGI